MSITSGRDTIKLSANMIPKIYLIKSNIAAIEIHPFSKLVIEVYHRHHRSGFSKNQPKIFSDLYWSRGTGLISS